MIRFEQSILLVEDEALIAADLVEQLDSLGYGNVDYAPTLAKATELLNANRYDLAMLDFDLGDGTSTRSLSEAIATSDIAVLFVSGFEGALLPAVGRRRLHLKKPVTKSELQLALSTLLAPIRV